LGDEFEVLTPPSREREREIVEFENVEFGLSYNYLLVFK